MGFAVQQQFQRSMQHYQQITAKGFLSLSKHPFLRDREAEGINVLWISENPVGQKGESFLADV